MSRYLDGSPKPVDPVWYRRAEWLRLRCAWAALRIGALAARHGLPGETRLYQLVDRMRCSHCGDRPAGVAVTPRRSGLGA